VRYDRGEEGRTASSQGDCEPSDDEDDDEIDPDNTVAVVNEDETVVINESHMNLLKKHEVRVAVRMVDDENDNVGRWYAGVGKRYRAERIPFTEHGQRNDDNSRRELFRHSLEIYMDDAEDELQGERIYVDSDLRRDIF